jgi:hypothetical protein
MSADPTYPEDAPVSDSTPRNEMLEAAISAKEAEERAKKPRSNKASFVRGAAIGIGSAAVVAALLYANRSRKDKG